MTTTADPDADAKGFASSPCLLHELGPDGAPEGDPRQAADVTRWRKAERERLLAARLALPAEVAAAQTQAIIGELDRLIEISADTLVSVYWPIRAEPDLRDWMRTLRQRGARVALPVAIALGKPLVFREWQPGARMTRGLWKIPYPADGAQVVPTVVIAPLVGFDERCYRLGYGGGFFDRTLAQFATKPIVIGVGYPSGCLRTIYPQPHDIPMNWIVTGTGAARCCVN